MNDSNAGNTGNAATGEAGAAATPGSAATTARDEILARVRAARRRGHLPSSKAPDPAAQSLEAMDRQAWLERAIQEWKAIGVRVALEDDVEGVHERLREVVEGLRVLAWDAERLPYDSGAVLESHERVDREAPREVLERAEVGVTGVDAAIAETGTLALVSRPGQTRLASLVPPRHVALVRRDQLLPTLGQFFALHGAGLRDASCVNFITGPSRTADIELQLTLCVHGPGELVVIVGP